MPKMPKFARAAAVTFGAATIVLLAVVWMRSGTVEQGLYTDKEAQQIAIVTERVNELEPMKRDGLFQVLGIDSRRLRKHRTSGSMRVEYNIWQVSKSYDLVLSNDCSFPERVIFVSLVKSSEMGGVLSPY